MNKVSAIVAAAVLAGHCLCVQPGWAAETPPETGGQEAPASKADLTQGSLTAYDLPAVTAFGVADQAPTVPVQTRFGTGYAMLNFIPKYMTKEGYELRIGAEGGSFGTVAENVGMGAKKDNVDIYAAQSLVSTLGHKDHTAAYQASYYGNMGIGLSDNWSLRMMANRVDAQTQVPNNPITNTRTTDRYDTQTSLATLSLINKYNNANGYLKGYYNDTLFYLRGENSNTTHRCKPTICTDCEAAKPIPSGKAAR